MIFIYYFSFPICWWVWKTLVVQPPKTSKFPCLLRSPLINLECSAFFCVFSLPYGGSFQIIPSMFPRKLQHDGCRAWWGCVVWSLRCFPWAGITDIEVHGHHSNQRLRGQNGREINPWKLSQAFSTLKYTKVQKYLPIPKSDMPREK